MQAVYDPLDRNKSDLTHSITGTAMGWLSGGGFKPVETEVPVAGGFVADIASFIYPTPTEWKCLKLNRRFDGTKGDPYDTLIETTKRFGTPLTAVIEVKISNADLKKDFNTKFRNFPAHLCYIAYPHGLIDETILPIYWSRLVCSANGQKLLRVDNGYVAIHPQSPGDTIDLIANIAIRRHHRTQYAEMRAMLKAWRRNGGYR